MGYLNSEKFPDKYTPAFMKLWVERIRTAVNYIDATNFPRGLNGSVIVDRSLSLLTKVTGYAGLVIGADFFTTPLYHELNATSYTGLGGLVLWSPTWKTIANIFLEVTLSVADASYPADIKLVGAGGDVYTFEEISTIQVRREFDITSVMPATGTTIAFQAKVDNATYPVYINSARLIYKLKE